MKLGIYSVQACRGFFDCRFLRWVVRSGSRTVVCCGKRKTALYTSKVRYHLSPPIFFVALGVLFFRTTELQALALPQGETRAGSQESTPFDNAFRQLRDGWQHRTIAEQKKAAAILIAEADKASGLKSPKGARALDGVRAIHR